MSIVWKWLVVGLLLLLLAVANAGVNRNVYSKAEVDTKFDKVEVSIDKRLENIEDDIEWLTQYLIDRTEGEGDVEK